MYSLIIMAAGSGSRMQLGYNKLLYKHNNKEIISYTLEKFLSFSEFSQIIIATSESDLPKYEQIVQKSSKIEFAIGGDTRARSTQNCLCKIKNNYVFIHDGARCFISQKDISNMLKKVKSKPGYTLYKEVTDTIHLSQNGTLVKKLDRSKLCAMQTPQAFETKVLKDCYEGVIDFEKITDEVGLLLENNINVELIKAIDYNEKFTNKEDIRSLSDL